MRYNCYGIKGGVVNKAIVFSWTDCEFLVKNRSGVQYKGFTSLEDAHKWLYDVTEDVDTQSRQFNTVYLYSDGGCIKNPGGPGGWGCIIKCNNYIKELSGGKADTTNNEMELTGFLEGIKNIKNKYGNKFKIVACLDSQYVINGASKWLKNWESNNWKRGKNEDVKNKGLWIEISREIQDLQIEYVWVRGHNGHPENERCDELATKEYQKFII